MKETALMKCPAVCFIGVVLTACFSLFFSPDASAQITWTGGGADTNWGTGANWSTGSAPGGTNQAIIGANASTVTVAASAAASQLTLGAAAANSITLQLNSNLRIGTSLTVEAGSAYDHAISSTRTLYVGAASSGLTGTQTVTFTNNSDHLLSFNGTTGSIAMGSTGTGGATMTLAFAGGGSFVVNQKIIQDTSANASTLKLTKTGTGTLTLNSTAIAYNGTTTINGGTLLVNGLHTGGGAYQINSGGTLGGGGEIITAGNAGVTVAAGGKLDAGTGTVADTLAMNLGTGTLDVSGAVVGDSQSLLFNLGSVSDKILLEGATTLSIGSGLLDFNDFAFTLESGFAPGTYTLFETSSLAAIAGSLGGDLTGTLSGYEATLSLGVNGNGYDTLILTVVPEPSVFQFLLAGSVALLLVQRRLARVRMG